MEAALELRPAKRDAYLDIACDGDLELRRATDKFAKRR